jgi:hypothetical protein
VRVPRCRSYIRTAKPKDSPELLAAVALLAREELTQFGACRWRRARGAGRARR